MQVAYPITVASAEWDANLDTPLKMANGVHKWTDKGLWLLNLLSGFLFGGR